MLFGLVPDSLVAGQVAAHLASHMTAFVVFVLGPCLRQYEKGHAQLVMIGRLLGVEIDCLSQQMGCCLQVRSGKSAATPPIEVGGCFNRVSGFGGCRAGAA